MIASRDLALSEDRYTEIRRIVDCSEAVLRVLRDLGARSFPRLREEIPAFSPGLVVCACGVLAFEGLVYVLDSDAFSPAVVGLTTMGEALVRRRVEALAEPRAKTKEAP